MRERKLRAWDRKKKIMINDLLCFYDGDNDTRISHDNSFQNEYMWNCKDLDLMDYIGRQDDSGNDIYEYDIVRYRDCVDSHERVLMGIVKWVDDECCFQIRDLEENSRGRCYRRSWWSLYDIEVIGDKYRNKELLKEGETK